MRLTHRMIEVFRLLVQTGNATRTAEMLCTSQPSISRDLSRLEQVTGILLFERRGGRLYPTAPALALYERAGWRQLHVRRRYYQPGDVDALILGKTLLTGPAERGTTEAFGNNAGGGEGE